MAKLENDVTYKKVSALVKSWLFETKPETFDLDYICRNMGIQEAANRKYVAIVLNYLIKRGDLEKARGKYRFIDKEIEFVQWENADVTPVEGLIYPYDVEQHTSFGFEDCVILYPGDLIVIAGVSNMGKTAWCLNFLVNNMDTFKCRFITNELGDKQKFKARISHFDWVQLLNEEGKGKFEVIKRYTNWQDIILPNAINIIDWINLAGDRTYDIGTVMQSIQSKLREGIAVISIQKSEGNPLGRGKDFSRDLASLYLTIDYEKLTVAKCKSWKTNNPNNKMFGFSIVDRGSKFVNIREVQTCFTCKGARFIFGKKCERCVGKGYIEKDEES